MTQSDAAFMLTMLAIFGGVILPLSVYATVFMYHRAVGAASTQNLKEFTEAGFHLPSEVQQNNMVRR